MVTGESVGESIGESTRESLDSHGRIAQRIAGRLLETLSWRSAINLSSAAQFAVGMMNVAAMNVATING